MKLKNHNRSGFTIVEIIVYISITVVMITIFSDLTIDLLKTTSRIANTNQVQSVSRFVLDRISQEIKTATGTISIAPNQLSLVNNDGSISKIFSYDQADKIVYLSDSVNKQRMSSENIQINNLSFSKINEGVQIQLEVQAKQNKNGGTYRFVQTAFVVPRQKLY